MTKCTICNHPRRLEIEEALGHGQSCPAVAKAFQLPKSTLQRHALKCSRKAIERVAAKRELASGNALADRIEDLQLTTAEILHEARTGIERTNAAGDTVTVRDSELALKAISTARKNIEMIAKLTGKLQPREDERRLPTFAEFEAIYLRVRQERVA